jgi:hypothetical protein
VQALKPQHPSFLKALQITRIDEQQRQDAVVHEIFAVDARNAVRQHDTRTRSADGKRGLVTARSLPVVASADNGMTIAVALAPGPRRIRQPARR